MIEGLKFDVKGEELKKHLSERAEHHTKRAAFYRKQEKEFLDNAEESRVREGQNTMKRTHEAMKESAERHDSSARRYRYLADHVVAGTEVVYRLSEAELAGVESWEGSEAGWYPRY